MTDRFFYCVSIVLHPIFLTTLGMIFIAFARMIGYVSSFQMRERRERVFALTVAAVCAFAFGHILNNWHAPAVMHAYVLGSALMLTLAALMSLFTRISLHAIGCCIRACRDCWRPRCCCRDWRPPRGSNSTSTPRGKSTSVSPSDSSLYG